MSYSRNPNTFISACALARRRLIRLAALVSVLVVSSCATTPEFNLAGVIQYKTPKQLVDQFETLRNSKILIGGTIVNTINTQTGTQIEILAFPLDTNHYPQIDTKSSGRFLAINKGFLETADFSPGKPVSLVGKLTDVVKGKIGDTDYTYPNLEISQIFLWTPYTGSAFDNVDTHLHIGVGVFIRR